MAQNSQTRVDVFLLFALVALFAVRTPLLSAERKESSPRESRENRFLKEAEIKLHDRLFGADEKRTCEKLLGETKGSGRLRLLVIMSQYHRLMEKAPLEALEVLGETVLAKGKVDAWKKAQSTAEKEVRDKWLADCQKARSENAALPPQPSGLQAPFPPTDQWSVGASNIECAIEIAHAHMDMKLWREALKIADLLGRNFEGITRVLAGECAADAMAGMSRFDQAVELYRFALSGFPTLASYDGKIPAEYDPIRKRIGESLARALRQQEIEKYGLGYVLYRDARWKQHRDKACLEALLMYEDLARQFDKTVYGEAARAYSCQCLLALAEPESRRKSQESIRKQEEVIQARESRLALMRQTKVPKGAIGEVEKAVAVEKERLRRLVAAPLGKEAATLAGERVTAFVKENEFGLYRGEALVDCAEYVFERQLDSSAAERLFRQAWAWLENVESVDAQLAAYEVPDKARAVSAPPKVEEKTDFFGNVKRVELPPEAIVNRRTCRWYLNDLRERCALALGFLEFVKGRQEESLEWFAKVVALDSATGYLESKGEWNNYRRMKWGAEHGYLFAYPEELKLYSGRQRFAILLGDFYYCTERFGQAGEIAKRLLDGECGKLEGKLRDFPQLVLGSAICWTEGRKPAFLILEKALKPRHGTFTEDRILFALGNIPPLDLDVEMIERGCAYMKELAYSSRNNEYVYRARLAYGWRLLETPEEAEGIKVLQSIPKSATDWKEVADFYLRELEEKRQTSGQAGK